jgi:hypothetical protein
VTGENLLDWKEMELHCQQLHDTINLQCNVLQEMMCSLEWVKGVRTVIKGS